MYFLRVEVVLKGPSYCVVITDADSIPPPARIDNFSEVSLHFYQVSSKSHFKVMTFYLFNKSFFGINISFYFHI